ncbi:unnamed protein product, partial [Didymodactylos carnosus]
MPRSFQFDPSGVIRLYTQSIHLSLTAGVLDIIIFSISFYATIQAAVSYANTPLFTVENPLNLFKRTELEVTEYRKEVVQLLKQDKRILKTLTEVILLTNEIQDGAKHLHDVFKLLTVQQKDNIDMDASLQKAVNEKLDDFLDHGEDNKEKSNAIKVAITSLNNKLASAYERVSIKTLKNRNKRQSQMETDVSDNFVDLSTNSLFQLNSRHSFLLALSYMIFIHSIGMSILQYLGFKNTKWFLLSVTMALLIIGQSLALLLYLQITNVLKFTSPLYLYTL